MGKRSVEDLDLEGKRILVRVDFNVPLNAAGEITGDWEVFADDFELAIGGSELIGRPSGLAVGPDGALYVGDDAGGRIWKITYTGS